MAVTVGYLLCIAAVLSGFINLAWTLECYQCNSHVDSSCFKTPLDDSLKMPCQEGKNKMCRKITQTVEVDVNNGLLPDTRVIRTCGWDDSNYLNKCYQRAGFGGRSEVCSCTTDNCNSAGATEAIATLLAASLISLLCFW